MRGLQIPLPASLHQEQFRGRRGGEGDFFFLNVFPPFSPLRKHFFSLSSKGMCEAPNDCVAVFSHHRRKSSFFLLFLCHSSLALSFQLFLRVLLPLIDNGATLSSCFCATSSIRPPSRLSTLFSRQSGSACIRGNSIGLLSLFSAWTPYTKKTVQS